MKISIAATALLLVLLAACQGRDADAIYRNYLERLGRTLDTALPKARASSPPARPRPGELRLKVPPGKLGALDFLAISGCAVQVTIGKRNSSLGRMAKPSQRLLLELEYLNLAPECIAYQRDKGREDIATTLEQARELKRRQLPALVFNATLGGEEYRSFWRRGSADPAYPANISSAVITALETVSAMSARWLAGDYRADNLEFELALGEIAGGDGGALMAALARQQDWLRAADALLAARMEQGPLCREQLRPAAAQILPNVVSKYFVGDIQRQAAALGRRYHQLLPPLMQLESALAGALPQSYLDWQHQRDTLLDRFYTAPRRHVEQLQAILAPCQQGRHGFP